MEYIFCPETSERNY